LLRKNVQAWYCFVALKATILLMLLLALNGCVPDCEPNVLIADEQLQAYSEPDGDPAYIIQKGEVCTVCGITAAKQYQYIEVDCPNRGRAWVIDGSLFRVEGKQP